MEWPKNKKFAFTIVDDTDNSCVKNIKPVYDLLKQCGVLTTKTVWVYHSRDKFTGSCLLDEDYLDFVKNLLNEGFEIGLHGVGSGQFIRSETLAGIEKFKELLGFYPRIHINHAGNQDSIYWGPKRFVPPLSWMMRLLLGKRRSFNGDNPKSPYFWGDICKKHIKYIRNRVFNGINTMKYDPKTPYRSKLTDEYSNYWFSSSDAHTVEEFNHLLSTKKINLFEKERGFSIIYTHFASGYVDQNGRLNRHFEQSIRELASRDGWFVPAGTLLDFLMSPQRNSQPVSSLYLARLDLLWFIDRLIKKIRFGR